MGGKSKLTQDTLNMVASKWVRAFLEQRCVVRADRWEYTGDLYAAYMDYAKHAKRNSGQIGFDPRLTKQRFTRILTLVFQENNWFMDLIATPDGKHRLRSGLCLKVNSTMRAPEHLYPSMKKAEAKQKKENERAMAALEARIRSQHLNPDSADRATETPGNTQAERDKLALELWNKET